MVTWPATPTCPPSIDVVADRRAAGDADLRRQQGVPPDVHAVADLHEVVDLGAGLNARFADGGPIDRRVRADLDVVFDDDDAGLRNLLVRAVGAPDEAVAVGADHRAVLDDHAVADDDALADGHVRVNDAVVADDGAVADAHIRIDHRAIADARAAADRRKRPDRDVLAEHGVGRHCAERVDAGRRMRG